MLQMKNTIANQLLKFNNRLYGCQREFSEDLKTSCKKISSMVDSVVKHDLDDCDLWVFVQYRLGKLRSKKSYINKMEPKTLLQAIDEGIKIPDDATYVEITIQPVFKNNYDVKVVQEVIYQVRFGIGKSEELSVDQFKRRYGLTEDDNLFSIEDLKESKILKFYKRKKPEVNVMAGL